MAVTLSVSPLSKEVTVSLATFLFNCADVSDGFLSGSAIQEAPRAFCGLWVVSSDPKDLFLRVPNITDDPTAWASLIADLFFTLERHIESNGHVSVSFPCKRRSAQTQ